MEGSMAEHQSFVTLIEHLCEIHQGPVARAHRIQPLISRQDAKKQLKLTAFNAFFSYLKDGPIGEPETASITPDVENLLLEVYRLRSVGKNEEADRLNQLFHQLQGRENFSELSKVIRLLFALKGTGDDEKSLNIPTERMFKYPGCSRDQQLSVTPTVPQLYGDITSRVVFSQFYMHYPDDLFTQAFPDLPVDDEMSYSSVFQLTPGQGLGSDCLQSSMTQLNDLHEQSTQSSLFGGFVQGRVKGIELHLDMPDLNLSSLPEIRIPEFKCKKSISSSQLSEESGLGSGPASMSSSVITIQDSSSLLELDDAVWEKALTEPRSQHYTWEWIGYIPGPTERPYLTECGPETYNILITMRHRIASLLITEPVPLVPVTCHTLVKNILYMLNGVPSKLFTFDENSMSFEITPGLHVEGIASEILADYLSDFVTTGTLYKRLQHFSRPPVVNSFYKGGLIFQAFVTGIRKVLNYYSAALLECPQDLQLLQLKVYFHSAMKQISYLADLCRCHSQKPPDSPPGDFPVGMQLLTHLYSEVLVSMNSPHYPLLLSILQTTSAPFMLFIKDWAFHGVFTDSYQEFMICSNDDSLNARDETYWQKAYTLVNEIDHEDKIPHYLRDIVNDIVTCGKAINLLRICNPQHFMCNVSDSEVPSVLMTFSQLELRAAQNYCQSYVGRMQEVARQITGDRQDLLKRIEQNKMELQQMAHKIAEDEISRLQGMIDERKRKADAKKRVEFDRLKKQMEDDLKRREEDSERKKEEDREFMARMNREEDQLTEKEIELEKKARDELIAYYTELGEEAMHRERLALWKVRRARLSAVREAYLLADENRWSQEMKEAAQGKSILDSATGTELPNWVKRTLEEGETLEVIDEEMVTPPTDSAYKIVDLLEEGEGSEVNVLEPANLPNWATRGQVAENVKVIEVGSDDEEGFEEKEEEGEKTETLIDSATADKNKEPGANKETVNNISEVKGKEESELKQTRGAPIGGVAFSKPQIHLSEKGEHNSKETEEQVFRTHTHRVQGKHVTDVTDGDSELSAKSTIRLVSGINSLTETSEVEKNRHIKVSANMYSTKESDPNSSSSKPHLKFRADLQVNQESTEERAMIPRRHRDQNLQHITSETESQEWKIKKPNLFGHSSQLSNTEYILQVPKLKRQSTQQASMESSFKDFGIKPRIRMSKTMSATKESDETDSKPARPHIRMQPNRHANTESERVDEHAAAIKRFRERNLKGHSSDSTVQKLLYGSEQKDEKTEDLAPLPRLQLIPGQPLEVELYTTDFSDIDSKLSVDLMSDIYVADLHQGLADQASMTEEDLEAYKYTPLSVLLAKSITTPIRAQISLVNTAVINYFTSELKVDDHFLAIRRYLLMADGDFAEILSNILLEKLSTNPLPQEILNCVFLNGTLNKAIRSSIHSDDEYTKNLSFAVKYMPSVLMPNEPNSLKCLELQYSVSWPLNIVLTSSSMEKYHQVFSFLLQIKRVVWVLKDIWHRLKRDALINNVGNCSQFRHLQLHRQEMEHFVKMMQGYITNQVIHVSWQEFQASLSQPIAGLDQLTKLHQQYVDRAISRCLLDKKAVKVMKVIKDIFCLILKFRSQLVSATWQQDTDKGEFTHPNFSSMLTTYKSFHVYSFFLFKVVNRLSQKGYQPHLQELLLQLNFNDYYTEVAN